MELYKIAVDEYRFQVTLNATRSRDNLVLNSAIIAAGVTLLGQKVHLLAGTVFIAGFCVATLAGLVTHTQHNYYRETQDTKKLLERLLGISAMVVKTTPAAGSRRWRLSSVTRFNYIVIGMLCTVNILGALFSFSILPLPTQKSHRLPQSTVKTVPLQTPPLHRQLSKPTPVQPISPPHSTPP